MADEGTTSTQSPFTEYECRYCGSSSVVPVLGKRIDEAPAAGNKYRRHCLSCARWLPMCSKEYFKKHPRPHVLPTSSEPDRENLIPLEEYDYAEEINQAKSRFNSPSQGEGSTEDEAVTLIQRLDEGVQYSNIEFNADALSSELPALIAVIDDSELDSDKAQDAWEKIVLHEADFIRAQRRGFIADEE